jgi:hypothetical protein
VFAELTGLTDGVHDLAEQVFIGEIVCIATRKTCSIFSLDRAAIFLKSSLIELPDSSCWLSTRIVLGRCNQPPLPSSFRKMASCPGDFLFTDLFFPTTKKVED